MKSLGDSPPISLGVSAMSNLLQYHTYLYIFGIYLFESHLLWNATRGKIYPSAYIYIYLFYLHINLLILIIDRL